MAAGDVPPLGAHERQALRTAMRARRRQLLRSERQLAAADIVRMAKRARLLRAGMRIAAYLSHGNEVDLQPLLRVALRLGCHCYLPRIQSKRTFVMQFAPYVPGMRLRKNCYGIAEPDAGAPHIPVRHLDLVFVPLVAFDDHGSRLGSGAGFYDRCFGFLNQGRQWRRPRLIGVAYDFQQVSQLPTAAWDVPLDAVITPKQLLVC
jgi:5-formyltetrahydrofolate cyclo-ligase